MDFNVDQKGDKKTFNWSILLIISLAPIVTGIYRDGFAALFPFLQRDFSLTRAQLGLHSTFFFLTSALLAIYAGCLVDLKGSKWGLIFASLFMSIFFILHSIVPVFIVLLLLASFTGLAVSFINPASNKSIIEWFPLKWRSTALGILSTAFPIGGLLGSILLPMLGILIGWRKTMIFPSVLSLLSAIFIYYFYNNIRKEKNKIKKNNAKKISFWQNINQLYSNKNLMSISAFGFFLGAISGSIVSHFTLFLYLDYGLSESIAGLAFAFVQLGSIIGRPGWGIVSDRLFRANKRKTFLYIGILFTLLTIILNLCMKNIEVHLSILFLFAFLIGCAGRGWQGLYFATVAETVREEQFGIAIGFSLFFARSGIMLAPPIFGYIADLNEAYYFSWFLLGTIIFLTSIGQYVLYMRFQKRIS